MDTEKDSRLRAILSKPHPRILAIVRDHMSGLLYAIPSLRTLHQELPQARIELLANPYATTILEGCPYVDKIIPFFSFRQETSGSGRFTGLAQAARAWLHLVGKVDLVIHFRYVGPKTLLFCRFLGQPFQVGYTQGYAQEKYSNLLDIDLGHENLLLDSRERNGRIIEALGFSAPSPRMEMWVTEADEEWAKNFLRSKGWGEDEPLIVMHPGCHWGCNEWIVDRWARLGDMLQETTGGQIIITGDKREYALAQKIANAMKTPPIIAAGQTTLLRLGAIIKQAALVISVDTVPTQICQALRIPTVILMGAGNPKWNGPLPGEPMMLLQHWDPADEGTLPCDFAAGTCHGPSCSSRLANLTVEKVFNAAMTMLEEPKTAYIIGDTVETLSAEKPGL